MELLIVILLLIIGLLTFLLLKNQSLNLEFNKNELNKKVKIEVNGLKTIKPRRVKTKKLRKISSNF